MQPITVHPDQPLGEIVAAFPTAALIFKKYRIDFCCSGDRPLALAVEAKKLNVQDVIKELDEAYAAEAERKDRGVDWQSVDYASLVDHVVHTHHAYLKQELGGIAEFTNRIRNVHGSRHPELVRLDELFRQVRAELESHMQKEEAQIFPLVKQYAADGSRQALADAVKTIDELEAEHSAVGELLEEMRVITSDYALPPDACRSYTVTFQKLEELEDDMFQHIHLENNIMFPRLEKELSA